MDISNLRQYLDDLENAHQRLALPDAATTRVDTTLDVGHGLQAAVAMSQYRSVVRIITTSNSGLTVDKMPAKADRRAALIGPDRVATCLLVLIDPKSGTCTAATAGHLPPVVIRPDGSAEILDLLLHTGGLVEQRATDIDDAVRGHTDLNLPADGSLERLADALPAQLTGGIREDDIASSPHEIRSPRSLTEVSR